MLPHHAILFLFALALAAIVASHLVLIWRARVSARALLRARRHAAERAAVRPSAALES